MADDESRSCNNCGASGEARELLECSGCRLVTYCDKDCQKASWRAHKPTCKIAQRLPRSTDNLKLDGESDSDFDSVLMFAADHLPDLKHVSIWIPQSAVLNRFAEPRPTPTIKLTASVLKDFLRRVKLHSFSLGFEDCMWDTTRMMTDSGRALEPLGDNNELESLCLTNGVFDEVEELVGAIPSNLKVLELPYLVLGQEGTPWPIAAKTRLISALSSQSDIIRLRFADCYFQDSDLEGLLSNKPHLRSLFVTGCFGESFGRPGSFLTDDGFETIARMCPDLQLLSVEHHRNATSAGVKAILSNCKHLRELRVTDVQISVQEIESLVALSSKLLLFGSFNVRSKESLRNAVMASGGRTLLSVRFQGLAELSGLPPRVAERAAESKMLAEKTGDKLDDPTVANEWADLF